MVKLKKVGGGGGRVRGQRGRESGGKWGTRERTEKVVELEKGVRKWWN